MISAYQGKFKNRVKIDLLKILHKKHTFLDFSQPNEVTETWGFHKSLI